MDKLKDKLGLLKQSLLAEYNQYKNTCLGSFIKTQIEDLEKGSHSIKDIQPIFRMQKDSAGVYTSGLYDLVNMHALFKTVPASFLHLYEGLLEYQRKYKRKAKILLSIEQYNKIMKSKNTRAKFHCQNTKYCLINGIHVDSGGYELPDRL